MAVRLRAHIIMVGNRTAEFYFHAILYLCKLKLESNLASTISESIIIYTLGVLFIARGVLFDACMVPIVLVKHAWSQ